jgi:aminodeoxyfutalosine synthase
MTMDTTFDELMSRVQGGERLSPDDVTALAQTPDILPLGMLADASRRRLRGTTVTYARVARCPIGEACTAKVLGGATEIRLTGAPGSLAQAVSAITSARTVGGDRVIAGLSWLDVERLAEAGGTSISGVLEMLRGAGLDSLADLPLDRVVNMPEAIDRLVEAGFERLRLTVDAAPAIERPALIQQAADLQGRFACIQTLNPLPMVLNATRPTTGYEDVKTVALARLMAPNIPSIQVDWLRYGPKLAQVALTFGADDLDEVSPSDESPEGRRRAPIEEVRRNVEAAGFTPAERDGRFVLVP